VIKWAFRSFQYKNQSEATVIIELPHDGLSVSKRRLGAKSWIKLLTGVDTAKSDGYAFTGSFKDFGATVEVTEGTWFLAYVEDRSGSGTLRQRDVWLYRAEAGTLKQVRYWGLDAGGGWALKVRDEIAGLIAASQRDPGGRPPIGEQVCFTIPVPDLAVIDAIAERDAVGRSEVLRRAVRAFVASQSGAAE
jgi:hypothetical protein